MFNLPPNPPPPARTLPPPNEARQERLYDTVGTGRRCSSHGDPDWFTTDTFERWADGQSRAVLVCHGCAVADLCLELAHAMGQRTHVWGGVSLNRSRPAGKARAWLAESSQLRDNHLWWALSHAARRNVGPKPEDRSRDTHARLLATERARLAKLASRPGGLDEQILRDQGTWQPIIDEFEPYEPADVPQPAAPAPAQPVGGVAPVVGTSAPPTGGIRHDLLTRPTNDGAWADAEALADVIFGAA